jgi:hypothetical protein
MRLRWPCEFLACFAAGCASQTADEPKISFKDPDDGAFDMSEFLASRRGFVPVPIIITEPAVGYGGGLGLLFLHDKPTGEDGKPAKGPPSITAVVGAATDSDSQFGGVGHFGSWKEDHWRYTGLLGAARANLKFDGLNGGDAGTGGQHELDYELDGEMLRQQLLRRVGEVPLFLGLSYEYAHTQTRFDSGAPVAGAPPLHRESGSLAAVAQYDTRDTIFTPSRGVSASLRVYHYDELFGGDAEYGRIEIDSPMWIPLDPTLVLGIRPNVEFADAGTPFYAMPYVTLRGVPALRYQGQNAASLETELRWNFVPRWALVGFGGVGQAVASASDFGGESYTVTAGGMGFRYMLAKKYGLHVGIDVAKGPEEWVFYIQVGAAWR